MGKLVITECKRLQPLKPGETTYCKVKLVKAIVTPKYRNLRKEKP